MSGLRRANHEAALRVVGERPGVTAPGFAPVSGASDGTQYGLLRTPSSTGISNSASSDHPPAERVRGHCRDDGLIARVEQPRRAPY